MASKIGDWQVFVIDSHEKSKARRSFGTIAIYHRNNGTVELNENRKKA